jgi:hypothetical protein
MTAWFALAMATVAAPADSPDFAAEVRPILAKFCLKCHGPDEGTRKAGLRLDQVESALAPADSGERAIVPGKPEQSELIARLDAEGSSHMPPASTKMTLTAAQKDTLKRWIAAGGQYKQHWAFVPPHKPSLPKVAQESWVRQPIDRFTLARMEARKVAPAPQADPVTLIRRVTYDLIGLPPDPAVAAAFAKNPTDEAFAQYVDRLLADPRYGERWARPWLDLARYADTNGYEKDRMRSIWLWRDWVIGALNRDMPYDRFSMLQLAGDLVSGAGQEGLIATGFHRNTMTNEEGGIDPLEFRFHAMTDRVATTGTTWLGLTLGCAQCHTHKYDPLVHQEYYSIMAFLDNAEETNIEVPTAEELAKRKEIIAKIEALKKNLKVEPSGMLADAFEEWAKKEKAQAFDWTTVKPEQAVSNEPLLRVSPDGIIRAEGDTTKNDLYTLKFAPAKQAIAAIRLEALPDANLPGGGPGMTWYEGPFGDFFLADFQVDAGGQKVKFASSSQSFANAWLGGSASDASKAIDDDLQTGWSANGNQGKRSIAVFILDKPIPPGQPWTLKMTFGRHYAASLGKFRLSVSENAKAIASPLPAEAERALVAWPNATGPEKDALLAHFCELTPEFEATRKQIAELRKSLPLAKTTMVMKERPADNARITRLRHRGEYLSPKDPVRPGLPSFLPPFSDTIKDQKAHRLAFAQWLFQENNPLTARVAVNRQWAALFGQGIVRTLDDFGLQGEVPSHPELLDWLALHFMEDGWSMKRLHRMLVLSSTYRQSSASRPELSVIDPDNRLFARGPRHRLDAEMIRDGALEAAGILSRKMGGPGVFPPQPASITTEGTYGPLAWKASTGEDRYRRSIYTFVKRTAPFAMAQTFDAPSGEACTAKRDRSNTPLQALQLLNDPAMLEAARALAQKAMSASKEDKQRVNLLIASVLTRQPDEAEQADLLAFVKDQTAAFAKDPARAKAFLGKDAKEKTPDSEIASLAAWTALARLVLNLDETLVKR